MYPHSRRKSMVAPKNFTKVNQAAVMPENLHSKRKSMVALTNFTKVNQAAVMPENPHSNRRSMVAPKNFSKVNQAAVMPENSADELPKQLHSWCIKMKLMPPNELPSIDELAKLCRGNARLALSYIIRHYQPRDRVIAFRRVQAAKANLAENEALLAERSRLKASLSEKDAEVEEWKAEVERLEKQLKETKHLKREWDLKTEEYEAQTRLLTAKAGEINMRLQANKRTSKYLKSLAPTQPVEGAPKLSDERKVALVGMLKSAGNDEKALKEVVRGVNSAELVDSLMHSQKQLLRKAEDLATVQSNSEEVQPSALEEELLRLQHEIATTKMATHIAGEEIKLLQEEQEELEQACVDAIMAGSSNSLLDTVPASEDAERLVEAFVQRVSSDTWHAKLTALEAEEAEEVPASDPIQLVSFTEDMLKAQREMRTLTADVQELLTELVASEANAERFHAQALAALADSPMPGDVALFRERFDALAESITALAVTGGSAVKATLQERVIEAQKVTVKYFKAQKYLSALKSVNLPNVEPLDENIAVNACATEAAIVSSLDAQLAKLREEISTSTLETSAALEAAAHREHPVRLLVPQEMTVGGRSYQEWEEQLKAAVACREGSSSESFAQQS